MTQEFKILIMIICLQFVFMGSYVAKNDKEIREIISTYKEKCKVME